MVFQIKERIFSFGDDFGIKDSYGNDAFFVKGKVFSIGDKLSLYDAQGKEIYYLQQKLFKLLPEYTIYQGTREVAWIKKKLSFFGAKFVIESAFGEFEIEGKPFDYNFMIRKNQMNVAKVSKEFFSFSDTYGVEIDDSEEHAFILALVIVVDQVIHDDKKNN